MENNWDVEASEAAAACYGVELALHLGYEKIVLEGDAWNVISAIRRKDKDCAPIHVLFD